MADITDPAEDGFKYEKKGTRISKEPSSLHFSGNDDSSEKRVSSNKQSSNIFSSNKDAASSFVPPS